MKWIKDVFVMLRVIWYHLHDLKNMRNTHRGVLLLVKLQASKCNFTKSNSPPWVFFTFLNCTNGTKPCKTYHLTVGILFTKYFE